MDRVGVRKRRVQVDVAKLMPLTLVVLAVLGFLFLSTLFLDVSHPINESVLGAGSNVRLTRT